MLYLDAVGDDENECLCKEQAEQAIVQVRVVLAVDGKAADNDAGQHKSEELSSVIQRRG